MDMASPAQHTAAVAADDAASQASPAVDNKAERGQLNESEDALPSLEDMEDLILEAYNNMQSDGEHIFLPEDVASKLHYVAQLVKSTGVVSADGSPVGGVRVSNQDEAESPPPPPPAPEIPPSPSGPLPSPAMAAFDSLGSKITKMQIELHELESSSNQIEEMPHTSSFVDEGASLFERPVAKQRSRSYYEAEAPLSPVFETASTDDEKLAAEVPNRRQSMPASPHLRRTSARSSSSASPPPPTKTVTPPRERSRISSDATTRRADVRRKSSAGGAPAPVAASHKSPSPHKPATTTVTSRTANLATSRIKKEEKPTRERSSSSYEQRREAAHKLKEDKAQRELQARDAARKQREEARRKLEEAQQKELAAKRERVARMKLQKEQRKSVTKPSVR